MARRPLARLFPPPRAVTLAGRAFLVPELTLGELAEVDSVRESRRPDPLAGVRDLLWAASVPPSERHRFDRALALAEGEEVDGMETDHAGLAGEEMAALIRVALRRHHPDVTEAKADPEDPEAVSPLAAIYDGVTWEELNALRDATQPPDPMLVLCAALDRFCGTGGGDEDDDGPDWFALADRVSRSHGMSYEEISRMTMAQFANALSEGKPRDGRAPRKGEDVLATDLAWSRWLAGEEVRHG